MIASDVRRAEDGAAGAGPSEPGGLLDVLSVAAVVLGADGRIVLWSPQARDLFGWSAEEALGQYAARLLVAEEHIGQVLELFRAVMAGEGAWAGVFSVRHKDGSTRRMEFRNMRLLDERGDAYALGIVCEEATVRALERDLALSARLVAQSPFGVAVLDPGLRLLLVNPTLEQLTGIPAAEHLGRGPRALLPFLDGDALESTMREVLATGVPVQGRSVVGRVPADADQDRAWSLSCYRLEDPGGRLIGVALTLADVTDRYRASAEAAEARRRLALVARASAELGTTLDLEFTARELAELVVGEVADVAEVDVLDPVLAAADTGAPVGTGPQAFRALAVAASHEIPGLLTARPPDAATVHAEDRLVTRCVTTGRPVLVSRIAEGDLPRLARDEDAVARLVAAGAHSCLAVPLVARGQVLGVLHLIRTRDVRPFDDEDVAMAGELAARAAVCIDNARWYQNVRGTALTLQRHLLPHRPTQPAGLRIAYRYLPAEATRGIGGDWFDAIPLPCGRTALVVGDVMGHGINAAAAMGQLRTATRALAGLELSPGQVLRHLDRVTADLYETTATCVYAVVDPRRRTYRVALAGHPPPVLVRPGRAPRLLDLPTGVPLGVGGVPFHTALLELHMEDRLVLYTDGLVETRDEPIDTRLRALLDVLAEPFASLEETCDRVLAGLRRPERDDDVALLLAQLAPDGEPGTGGADTAGPGTAGPGTGGPGTGGPGGA
ncbi:SpoIIE family protein phosphatase [Streptomyces sp. NPDC047985]|uniref:SpoIIE family protein phosphatase n=1 Tax=Streptomyces sp. NPDC047985 TaxID=3155384 RepID=UPI00344090E8